MAPLEGSATPDQTKKGMKSSQKLDIVQGYGMPKSEDYPRIADVKTDPSDKDARFRREDLTLETVNNGYDFYTIGNAIFAKDISGYFYKLNNETKHFEWFVDGWLEDNDYTIGQTIPCGPTYVSYNKHGCAVFPTNDDIPPRPVLPRTEQGRHIFPRDPNTSFPLFPLDFNGEPTLPIDEAGLPVFPMDDNGLPIVPIGSDGYAVFSKDKDGMPILPKGVNGEPVPAYTIYGNAVVPFVDGKPYLPLDANGQECIIMAGPEKNIPMTLTDYYHWQSQTAHYDERTDPYAYDATMYENEEMMHAAVQQYNQQQLQQGQLNSPLLAQQNPHNATQQEEEAKKKSRLAMQIKFLKKSKGLAIDAKKVEEPKKDEKPAEPSPQPVIPANRPPLPNKEKERGERYIPEKFGLRRRFDRRDDTKGNNERRVGYQNHRGGYRNDYRGRNTRRRVSRSRTRSRTRSRSKSASRSRSSRSRSRSNSRRKFRRTRRSRSGSRDKRRTRSRSTSSATYSSDDSISRRRTARRKRSVSRNRSSSSEDRKSRDEEKCRQRALESRKKAFKEGFRRETASGSGSNDDEVRSTWSRKPSKNLDDYVRDYLENPENNVAINVRSNSDMELVDSNEEDGGVVEEDENVIAKKKKEEEWRLLEEQQKLRNAEISKHIAKKEQERLKNGYRIETPPPIESPTASRPPSVVPPADDENDEKTGDSLSCVSISQKIDATQSVEQNVSTTVSEVGDNRGNMSDREFFVQLFGKHSEDMKKEFNSMKEETKILKDNMKKEFELMAKELKKKDEKIENLEKKMDVMRVEIRKKDDENKENMKKEFDSVREEMKRMDDNLKNMDKKHELMTDKFEKMSTKVDNIDKRIREEAKLREEQTKKNVQSAETCVQGQENVLRDKTIIRNMLVDFHRKLTATDKENDASK